MSTTTAGPEADELSDRTFAASMVITEHNRLAEALMATVGLLDDAQRDPDGALRSVNVANLLKAMARMVYESRRTITDGLLFSIGDDGPLDEVILDAIAKSSDEAAEEFGRIDAEIKGDV